MPTYEYECETCGFTFEHRQAITAEPLSECPQCKGKARRLISAGTGFILKGSKQVGTSQRQDECSLKKTGRTCCGRNERCGKPPCGNESSYV